MKKRILQTFSAFALTVATLVTTTIPAYTMELEYVKFNFDKVWNNSGDAQTSYYIGNTNQVLNLKFGSKILDTDDYTVSQADDYNDYTGTVIKLKESALKKLPLKYGINEFTVEVKGNKNTSFIHSIHTLGNNENTIIVPKDDSLEFLSIANISGCKLSVLWDYWYTMTETDDSYIIKLSDEYLNKYAKSNEYYTYCLENYTFTLDLVKGEMGDVNCDEKIDLEDTKVALQATLGIIEETTEIKQLGDMDGDGKLSLTDTASVLKTALAIK